MKGAKYLTAPAVCLEIKTVLLKEDAENSGRKKSTFVMNAMICPVRILIVWTGVTDSVMT